MMNGEFLWGKMIKDKYKAETSSKMQKRVKKLSQDTLVNDPRFGSQIFNSLMNVSMKYHGKLLNEWDKRKILRRYAKKGKLRLYSPERDVKVNRKGGRGQ